MVGVLLVVVAPIEGAQQTEIETVEVLLKPERAAEDVVLDRLVGLIGSAILRVVTRVVLAADIRRCGQAIVARDVQPTCKRGAIILEVFISVIDVSSDVALHGQAEAVARKVGTDRNLRSEGKDVIVFFVIVGGENVVMYVPSTVTLG